MIVIPHVEPIHHIKNRGTLYAVNVCELGIEEEDVEKLNGQEIQIGDTIFNIVAIERDVRYIRNCHIGILVINFNITQ